MKKLRILLLTLVLIPLIGVRAEININKMGKLELNYVYGENEINDVAISIYHVAYMDEFENYHYMPAYEKLTFSLEGNTSFEWNILANNIESYIKENNLEFNESKETVNGKTIFENLNAGLYLVIADSAEVGDYEYSSSSSLVAVPNYDAIKGDYIYGVSMYLKTEAKLLDIEGPPKTDEKPPQPSTEVPSTLDAIYIYVGLFLVSIAVIVLIIRYLKEDDRSEKKDENNKEN